MKPPRYVVRQVYRPGVGWASEISDTAGARRIFVAGADHQARADRRAAELNGEAKREGQGPGEAR